ncbi:MAG TPA: PEP/pyruvate-binding domain-containing protein [Polyangiales bacterium]|nr:PEP/pyruvate-binding domain-containing protein [Polyangiales bacterium]
MSSAEAKIVALEDATDPLLYGGKALHLGSARRAGLPAPPGVALSVQALALLVAGDAAISGKVREACAALGAPLAARSSAIGEDSHEASYAGQYLSLMNLMDADAVIDGLCQIHASAQSLAVQAYRDKKQIAGAVRIAAVVQKLIDPLCAGVLFTRHPVTHADEYVIEATWGLGEAVVAGLVTPDHFRLARDGRVLESRAGDKDIAVRRAADGGTQELPVDDALIESFCLEPAQLKQLYELARRCEASFGVGIPAQQPAALRVAGLDLEWAFSGGELYLLQARPISTGGGR